MLADCALELVIRPGLRVGECGGTLYGLLIYSQRDRAWYFQKSAEESNSRAEEWVRQNLGELLLTPPDYAAGEVVAYKAK